MRSHPAVCFFFFFFFLVDPPGGRGKKSYELQYALLFCGPSFCPSAKRRLDADLAPSVKSTPWTCRPSSAEPYEGWAKVR